MYNIEPLRNTRDILNNYIFNKIVYVILSIIIVMNDISIIWLYKEPSVFHIATETAIYGRS